jgi:hypothetical protein
LKILKGLVDLRGLYKIYAVASAHNNCQDSTVAEITKFGYPTSLLETVLLQLNFPVFLRESARAAAPRTKAVATCTPTNAIALAKFAAIANLSRGGRVKGTVYMHFVNVSTYL